MNKIRRGQNFFKQAELDTFGFWEGREDALILFVQGIFQVCSNLREQLDIFLPLRGVNRLKSGRGGKGRVEKRPDKLEWWQTQQITLKTISSLPLIFSYSAQSASGSSLWRSWNGPLRVINARAGRNLTNTGKATDGILSGKRLQVVFEISPNSVSGEEADE